LSVSTEATIRPVSASVAETTVGRYKAIIGPKLRARSMLAQQGEIAIAVEVLNHIIRVVKPISIRAA
jgi:hypothetical protein